MTARIRADSTDEIPCNHWVPEKAERPRHHYTIFEGTSEIQRLVIARAISGVHIK